MNVVREPLVRYGTPPAAEAKTNGASAEPEERPVRDRACRTEGCDNRANANPKWHRGALAGLCWETCVPKAREDIAAAARRRHREAALRTVDVEPELPAEDEMEAATPLAALGAEPPVEAEPERESSLAELAADLERARLFLDDAEEVYEDAVAAFLDHPLVRQLGVGHASEE